MGCGEFTADIIRPGAMSCTEDSCICSVWRERRKSPDFQKGCSGRPALLLALSVMPRYLFLDETFDGLDIAKRQMLTKILKNYTSRRNALVIVTSHYLNELEHIADEIGMIDGDRLIVPDTRGGSLESYFLEKSEVDEDEIERLFDGEVPGIFEKKRDEKDGAFSRSKNKRRQKKRRK